MALLEPQPMDHGIVGGGRMQADVLFSKRPEWPLFDFGARYKYSIRTHWKWNSWRERAKYSRLSVWVQGVELEASCKNKREYLKVLRGFFPPILATLQRQNVQDNDCPKDDLFDGARWNQRAGCSCGCSPGFILHAERSPGWSRPARWFFATVTLATNPF